jgi:hypothetical protein
LRTAADEPFASHGSFKRRMTRRCAGPMISRLSFCRAFCRSIGKRIERASRRLAAPMFAADSTLLARNRDGCRRAAGACGS